MYPGSAFWQPAKDGLAKVLQVRRGLIITRAYLPMAAEGCALRILIRDVCALFNSGHGGSHVSVVREANERLSRPELCPVHLHAQHWPTPQRNIQSVGKYDFQPLNLSKNLVFGPFGYRWVVEGYAVYEDVCLCVATRVADS